MRSIRAKKNLLAVSANAKETAINTFATLDTTIAAAMTDIMNLEPRRESNADEATGKEEADLVYDLGNLAGFNLNFEKAQPQHFAFLLAFGMGSVATAAAGTGYEHTITPIVDDLDEERSNPGFTAAQRFGTIGKRRFASCFVDSFTAQFNVDSFLKLTAAIKGTGKHEDSVTEESVTAMKNATSLTLAANGVAGSTAAERLANIHRIRVELDSGVWTEVAFSAVSSATPAVITITAPGATTDTVNYKILYAPTEVSWMTFPAKILETPLRIAETFFTLGGTWNGSAFSGGRVINTEIRSLEWQFNNNMAIEFVPGAGDAYAGRAFRDGRVQAIKMSREFREFILQQHIKDNDTFGLRVLAQGAVFDDPHKYQVDIVWPKVSVLSSPINVDGKRLAEAGDLLPLQDGTYGSVVVKVKNLQSAYAA